MNQSLVLNQNISRFVANYLKISDNANAKSIAGAVWRFVKENNDVTNLTNEEKEKLTTDTFSNDANKFINIAKEYREQKKILKEEMDRIKLNKLLEKQDLITKKLMKKEKKKNEKNLNL